VARAQYVRGEGGWSLRFVEGEREARKVAGEWTGKTLAIAARERATEEPDVVAISGETGGMTYAEFVRDAEALTRGFLTIGVKRGETISFQLPNWIEAAVVNLACAFGGFVVNPIIPIYRQSELRFILKDCKAKVILVPASFRGVDYPSMIAELSGELPDLAEVIVVRGAASGISRYEDILELGRESNLALTPLDPDEIKFIVYTSGTTGQPKGVIYSHNQSRRPLWASLTVWKERLPPRAKILMPSPVTHMTGYHFGLEAPFQFGLRVVVMERWDASRAAEIIDAEGINLMTGATPFLQELLSEAKRRATSFPSLNIFACGGAAVPPDLVRHANNTFSNCRTFRVFGASECPMVSPGVLDDIELAAITDGRIYDWDVKLIDEGGNAVGPGIEGQILVRGPSLFRGYTSLAETEASFDSEGYFRTGDIGTVTQDALLTITGRKKDIIIRGGENISAKEIEDVLHEHPAVYEVAVVAMPHARLGEGICAYIVAASDDRPDRAALSAYLNARGLARQKWPERVEYVESLPKTASGKVQKYELRRMTLRTHSERDQGNI
jgi:non-ribosomal peptide synthetase component E (peptide arylation enzyme)